MSRPTKAWAESSLRFADGDHDGARFAGLGVEGVAGLGVAFLSLHTCMLELGAGLLERVSMPGNPIVREWFVMHLADKAPPPVAAAFREYLIEDGQLDIDRQLRAGPAMIRRKAGTRRAAAQVLK